MAAEDTFYVEEAAQVAGDDRVWRVAGGIFGGGDIGAFFLAYGGGEAAELLGESSAEAAAFFAVRHFDDFGAGGLQELAWGVFDAEFAQSGA